MLYNQFCQKLNWQKTMPSTHFMSSIAEGVNTLPRFFVAKDQICDGLVRIVGEDAHHIARSLRMAAGQHVTVCDMQKTEYDCELLHFEDDRVVTARIVGESPMETEPPVAITLYQALPKGDKLDTIIQKAVECGASHIVPFESINCVVRVKQEAEARKTERRNRIATEAAKQCGRGMLPEVTETVSFEQMITLASQADLVLFCYEGEGTVPLKALLRGRLGTLPQDRVPSIAVVIGSEGGFSPSEAKAAQEAGFCMTGLGARILRTETASCFILSSLVYEFEL
ncbi:MAG: 16S rRNA (uracil(1498)-N(3))-methyltransferase [Ruminococcaceae bacterium]|nr:16S rRNA (uracil(1498)-N(3))-methyltransferase [Oscillospiraceae bacterium]